MGSSASSNPFAVSKHVELMISKNVETIDDDDNKDDVVDWSIRRKNVNDFQDRIDRSMQKRFHTLTSDSAVSATKDISSSLEHFMIDRAMKYFNVDGMDPKNKSIFKKILFPSLRLMNLPSHTVVFKHGEEGTNLYLVDEGELLVSDADGSEFCLVDRGSVFGETSMLYGRVRIATITTLNKCKLWSLGTCVRVCGVVLPLFSMALLRCWFVLSSFHF